MSARELDAAGITDPALRAAYRTCRTLNARHGRTYFLATRLLPVERRPAVHSLYGFARHADDIVDDLDRIPSALRGVHHKNPVNLPSRRGVQIELPPRVRGSSPMWWDWEHGLVPHTESLIDALARAVFPAHRRFPIWNRMGYCLVDPDPSMRT